tara:strand:- start:741 stop:1241 length:501 start_codon:yes stop_codon:yes gene_type:complete
VQNIVYASGAISALFVVVGLLLIDVGASRRRSGINSTIEKLVGFFIGFATFFFIGFSIWTSQYYIMNGDTMADSIRDWWAGGLLANSLAQNVDPAAFAGIKNYQIFIFFIAAFAGITNILLHFAVAERMKSLTTRISSISDEPVQGTCLWVSVSTTVWATDWRNCN